MNLTEFDDSTKLFRIFDLSDIVNSLDSSSLRMSQASSMSDKNELLADSLLLLNSTFGPMTQFDGQRFFAQRKVASLSQYMSCWATVPNSIALWSLYSANRRGIMASTTLAKLKRALFDYSQANSYVLAYELPPNDTRNLVYPAKVGSVKYVELAELYRALRDIRTECERRKSAELATEEAIQRAWRWREEETERYLASIGVSSGDLGLIKDERYEHEKEVRAIIRLVQRDGRTAEEYKSHPLAGLDDPVRPPKPSDCPSNLFVPIHQDFFETLQFDGRLQSWERAAITAIFDRFGVHVAPNTTFEAADELGLWSDEIAGLLN